MSEWPPSDTGSQTRGRGTAAGVLKSWLPHGGWVATLPMSVGQSTPWWWMMGPECLGFWSDRRAPSKSTLQADLRALGFQWSDVHTALWLLRRYPRLGVMGKRLVGSPRSQYTHRLDYLVYRSQRQQFQDGRLREEAQWECLGWGHNTVWPHAVSTYKHVITCSLQGLWVS